jgi:thioredoxin-related protein
LLLLQKNDDVRKSLILLCLLAHAVGSSQEWNTDFETAKRKAVAFNKNILLVFSGSDWCIPCMELEKKVWQTPEFKAAAQKDWVLLRADFLQKKGDPEPVNVNDQKMILTEKYNRDGFFPFIVTLDKYGKVIGKVGYEEFDTAEEYIFLFRRMRK